MPIIASSKYIITNHASQQPLTIAVQIHHHNHKPRTVFRHCCIVTFLWSRNLGAGCSRRGSLRASGEKKKNLGTEQSSQHLSSFFFHAAFVVTPYCQGQVLHLSEVLPCQCHDRFFIAPLPVGPITMLCIIVLLPAILCFCLYIFGFLVAYFRRPSRTLGSARIKQ